MGAIHPKAVKQFLAQPRDSHVWMKKLTTKELDTALEEVGFTPGQNKEKLDKHQKVCILLGIAYKTFAFFLDMGLGKTRVALELIRFWIKSDELKTALVLAPSESVLFSWQKEISRWNINVDYVTLSNSSTEAKWDRLSEFEEGIILATFAGFSRMVTKLTEVKTKRKGRVVIKNKFQTNRTLMKRISKIIGAVVTDESTEIGNLHSLQYRICNKLAKTASIRYELAGRPFGRDPTQLWSQLYVVDRGETLGDTLGLFRAGFFEEEDNFWGGKKYKFKKELRPKLNHILRHRSIQYRYDECGTLPPMVPKIEEVSLPGEATAYYQKFLKEVRKSHAGFQERKNAFVRMRQVSSGFVGFKNDETGAKAEIAFADNPKLDRLLELVRQMPHQSKFLIFYDFTYSGRMVSEALAKLKIKHGWIYGGVKNQRQLEERFNDGTVDESKGLVVQERMGAFGANWQRANYLFFYESPVPVIRREQAERRPRRKGQKRTVFQYDLVCRGTADSGILKWHKEGASLWP